MSWTLLLSSWWSFTKRTIWATFMTVPIYYTLPSPASPTILPMWSHTDGSVTHALFRKPFRRYEDHQFDFCGERSPRPPIEPFSEGPSQKSLSFERARSIPYCSCARAREGPAVKVSVTVRLDEKWDRLALCFGSVFRCWCIIYLLLPTKWCSICFVNEWQRKTGRRRN